LWQFTNPCLASWDTFSNRSTLTVTNVCCAAAACREGSVVVADNLKIPGAPDYVKWMSSTQDFSFEQYSVCMGASALWLHDIIGVSVYKPVTAAA
jgi:hypothetical protein